jgi:hypothetical protein
MWLYKQKQGSFYHNDIWIIDGYSGFGDLGKNRPEAQGQVGVGPIPQGSFLVGGVEDDEHKHGPLAIHLIPEPSTKTFGRSGFMIHGDSKAHLGSASHGCIILPPAVRQTVSESEDRQLIVISGNV